MLSGQQDWVNGSVRRSPVPIAVLGSMDLVLNGKHWERRRMSPRNARSRLKIRLLLLAHPSWSDQRIYDARIPWGRRITTGIIITSSYIYAKVNSIPKIKASASGINTPSGQRWKCSYLDIQGHLLLRPHIQVTSSLSPPFFTCLKTRDFNIANPPRYIRKDGTVQPAALLAIFEVIAIVRQPQLHNWWMLMGAIWNLSPFLVQAVHSC